MKCVLTLLPRRTWNTGPYFLEYSYAAVAWSVPNLMREPKRGRPGTSGKFLIFGVSVLFKSLTIKYTTAMIARPKTW